MADRRMRRDPPLAAAIEQVHGGTSLIDHIQAFAPSAANNGPAAGPIVIYLRIGP